MWVALAVLFCCVVGACVLQALIIWSLLADIDGLRGDICHIAVTQHLIVVGCR